MTSKKDFPNFKPATRASVLVRRGDHPFEPLDVPMVTVDGEPAVVYLKKPSMRVLIAKIDQAQELMKAADGDEKKIETEAQREFSREVIRLCVVDEKGEPMFRPEGSPEDDERPDVLDLEPDLYNFLTEKTTAFLGIDGERGKAPSGASGAASPSDSPSPSASPM